MGTAPKWEFLLTSDSIQTHMEVTPADERGLDPVEETGRARDAAVQALKARLAVEEEAERSRFYADEALEVQRAAEQEAERARRTAAEAEQRRVAAEEEAERARLAAEEALQAWRATLAEEAEGTRRESSGRAEAPAEPEEPPTPEVEMQGALGEQVATRSAPTRHLTCVISYRREYRKVAFYAHAFDNEGSELVVAASPHFRGRGNGPPDRTEQAVAAYNDLVEQLASEGWELVGEGESWFEKTFRRRVTAAVE